MPSVFTLEGPRLGAGSVEYGQTIPGIVVQTLPPPPPPPPPKQRLMPRLSRFMRTGTTRTMAGTDVLGMPWWVLALVGVGATGIAYAVLNRKTKRKGLRGASMIATIAKESRSPDEYARRIEAWNAAEAKPLPITKLAKGYRKASPSAVARLIREAQEERLEKRERLWSKMSRGLRGLLRGYRVAFLDRGKRDVAPFNFDTPEQAASMVRTFKRRGWTVWVEDDRGNFVSVKGATKRPTGV